MKSILTSIAFMVAMLVVSLIVIMAAQAMQEDECADMGARRVATSGDRGLGYVCVSPDGRIVQ